ncbi:MAG: N-acetyltransferase [Saprospiraceae bacterium]|nr:N-acetyltransferase [Saprospiraceae bacterium]
MTVLVRKEVDEDIPKVQRLIEQAFASVAHSDHSEHHLVQRLRGAPEYVAELSLVAEAPSQGIVGHILLTPVLLEPTAETHQALGLAPVSVAPTHQSKGIGSKLIRAAHAAAMDEGFGLIVLIGHADYYPRFGYQSAGSMGIHFPFEVPDENCFALDLLGHFPSNDGIRKVVYPNAFGI